MTGNFPEVIFKTQYEYRHKQPGGQPRDLRRRRRPRRGQRGDCHGWESILFGQQTRLPHFPEDQRLPKLHSGHPLVLLFWKVLKKVPEHVRQALIGGPISVTLVRDDSLLCFRDCRHHQAVHLGRRRRTIYLPEVLLYQAEEMGYDYGAIAEG